MIQRALWCCVLFLASCASGSWSVIDPDNPTAECVGRLAGLNLPSSGDITLLLAPRPEYAYLMAPGQTHLPCEIMGYARDDFRQLLPLLTIGTDVKVWGHHVAHVTGDTVVHELRPATGVSRVLEE